MRNLEGWVGSQFLLFKPHSLPLLVSLSLYALFYLRICLFSSRFPFFLFFLLLISFYLVENTFPISASCRVRPSDLGRASVHTLEIIYHSLTELVLSQTDERNVRKI